jgi:hypothetical protein
MVLCDCIIANTSTVVSGRLLACSNGCTSRMSIPQQLHDVVHYKTEAGLTACCMVQAGAGDGEGGQEGEEGGGGESGEESPDYDILASDEDGEEGKEARAGGHHTPAVKPDPAGAMNNVAGQVQGSAGAKPVPKEEDEEEGNNKQLVGLEPAGLSSVVLEHHNC